MLSNPNYKFNEKEDDLIDINVIDVIITEEAKNGEN